MNNVEKNIFREYDNMDVKRTQSRSLGTLSGSYNTSRITNNCDPSVKYILDKTPIGRGSFSVVYYATDTAKINEFAIKQIAVSKLDPSRIDKFLIELNISLKMNHPNIVRCYEIFKTPTSWYIVNEYCNYNTFADLVNELRSVKNRKEKESLCHYYLSQLKNALKYLNANNIIHRDLKPMNILMTKTRETNYEIVVKLADFGFARYHENSDTNNTGYDDMVSTICGSPLYMAPELIIDKRYNTKADLWSYGVIMYELLYGINPYNYPKTMAQLAELMEKQKISFDPSYSENCMDILKKLLQTDPIKRIEWKDFFDHKWFSEFGHNSPSNSSPSDTKEDDMFDFDEDIDVRPSSVELSCDDSHFGKDKKNKKENDDDDFVLIDPSASVLRNVKTRKETYTGSVIKILTDSISYLFSGNHARSY